MALLYCRKDLTFFFQNHPISAFLSGDSISFWMIFFVANLSGGHQSFPAAVITAHAKLSSFFSVCSKQKQSSFQKHFIYAREEKITCICKRQCEILLNDSSETYLFRWKCFRFQLGKCCFQTLSAHLSILRPEALFPTTLASRASSQLHNKKINL